MKITMQSLVIMAFASLCFLPTAQSMTDSFLDECVKAVQQGSYRGGGMQVSCEGYYILPSPLLVKCIASLDDDGKITDSKLRQICQIHCESKGYYGPYPDYPGDGKFLLGSALFKRLFDEKRCSEL